jgi:hypothetical protein
MYKFELESVSGYLPKQFIQAPVGWDTNQPTLTRDETYHGVARSFTVGLTFIKDGYVYLNDLYREEGVLSKCLIYIYEHDNSTHEYELQDVGNIDFSSFNESAKEGQGLTLTITDTTLAEKIRGREDVLINYNKSTDLDDNAMSSPDYVSQSILGMEVISKGSMATIYEEFPFTFGGSGSVVQGGFAYPTLNYKGQTEGGKSVFGKYYVPDELPLSNVNDWVKFMEEVHFFKGLESGELRIDGSVIAEVLDFKTPSLNNYTFISLGKINLNAAIESGNVADIETEVLKKWESTGGGTYNVTLDITGSYEFVEGDYFRIYSRNGIETTTANSGYINYYQSDINLILKDQAPTTESKGVFLFDAFNRSIEAMTGVSNTLTSAPLDDDGIYHDYTLQNGFLIRNYTEEESAISWKFKDLFQNIEKIFNIGLAINSDNTTEIRKKIDFYKDGVIHTVTAKDIEADSFNREIDIDHFFSDIEIGYTKSAYEEISGLEEYNNESFYNTILSIVNNKLEASSKIRGDGYGIEFARRKQKEDDVTEDTKYDKDLFILNVIEDSGYKQLTTEGFSDVSGIDQITTPANLNITPAQNFRRWGWLLATGLQKYQDKKIKFNKADFESDLSTTKDGVTVTESADITYDELEAPIFTGHKLIFTAKLSLSDYKKIKNSPYQIIKVWNPIDSIYTYGWIREVGIESADKSTNWELIEAIEATEVLKFLLLNSGGFLKLNNGAGLLINDQS